VNDIDIFVCKLLQDKTLKKIEEELNRKLTKSELEVFYKASRIAMIKGNNYIKYGIL